MGNASPKPTKSVTRRYDGLLQMFVEEPREPSIHHLQFLRWLAERGRLDYPPFGPSSGDYAIQAQTADLPLA